MKDLLIVASVILALALVAGVRMALHDAGYLTGSDFPSISREM